MSSSGVQIRLAWLVGRWEVERRGLREVVDGGADVDVVDEGAESMSDVGNPKESKVDADDFSELGGEDDVGEDDTVVFASTQDGTVTAHKEE